MEASPIDLFVFDFKNNFDITLTKVKRKQIIFEGFTKNNKSLSVVMPDSAIYKYGNGWIDFTEIQINLLKSYMLSIAIFRLSDGNNYWLNLKNLFPLLSEENMFENRREGLHWKFDIWQNKLIIRKSKTEIIINNYSITEISTLLTVLNEMVNKSTQDKINILY